MPDGKVLTMKKSGASRDRQSIRVNEAVNPGYFVPHQLFRTGGRVEVVTK